ncbi:hypothetical protein C8R43DRAFT_72916 [Mycena crocata]|nr:hypothetical protein C8R43DRAFT_72916 [Mycena crocata]
MNDFFALDFTHTPSSAGAVVRIYGYTGSIYAATSCPQCRIPRLPLVEFCIVLLFGFHYSPFAFAYLGCDEFVYGLWLSNALIYLSFQVCL